MRALRIDNLPPSAHQELVELYQATKLPRIRTRAQMILLSAEQALKAPQIALIVRESERTIQRWLKRYQAEGINGLQDAPKSGKPSKVSLSYRQQLLSSVRQRPRNLGLEFSLWTLARLADYLAEQTGVRLSQEGVRLQLKAMEIVLSRPQHKISSPDPDYLVKKRRLKTRETS
ncbi:helix-turn-helix domain-containing protein [Spirosoma utsteinense]|nr:helix-turn-helix domain-containing protein [Spirosoma utsteinense]